MQRIQREYRINKRYKTLQNIQKNNDTFLQRTNYGINTFQMVKVPKNQSQITSIHNSRTIDVRKKSFSINTKNTHKQTFYMKKSMKLKDGIKLQTNKIEKNNDQQQLHQKLRINRVRASRIQTEANWLRQKEFQQFLQKTQKFQDLLHLNQRTKKMINHDKQYCKIGAIVIKQIGQDQQKQKIYKANIKQIVQYHWKPQSREGHLTIQYKDHIYLIGGHFNHPFNTIHVYSILANSWVKQIPTKLARSYQSCIIYKQRILILFGGMGNYDPSSKIRQCSNTINIFDMQTHKIKQLNMKNQQLVQGRKCHSASLFGTSMIVLGGINSHQQYLSNFLQLDMKQQKWYQKDLIIQNQYLKEFMKYGIAHHASVSMYKARKNYSIYSSDYDEMQGIYIFGGNNQKQQQNIVMKIYFQNFVPVLKLIHFLGKHPASSHSLATKHSQSIIIIVSGQINKREIHMFNIIQRTFKKVQVLTNNFYGGIKSDIVRHMNSYFIFYGIGDKGYKSTITKFQIEECMIPIYSKKPKKSLRKSQLLQESDDQQEYIDI